MFWIASLDWGIVIDVEVRVALIGLTLAGVDARIVVASMARNRFRVFLDGQDDGPPFFEEE